MQITIVDKLASWLPWLGGLLPAMLTYQNALDELGFEVWEAGLLAVIVEAIGFVAIATALDLWEMYRDELDARYQSWNAPSGTPAAVNGMFWVAAGGVLVYLFVVVSINAILDDGDAWHKITQGLMASFGLLGGLMVALRNQMAKRRMVLTNAKTRQDEQAADAKARQDEIEREEREHKRRMEEERLRLEHEERLRKLDEQSRRKLAKIEADGLRKVSTRGADGSGKSPDGVGQSPDAAGQSPDGAGNSPDVAGDYPATRLRWSDVSPDDYRWIADAHPADIVKRYKLTGKDPERLARTWKQYARERLS